MFVFVEEGVVVGLLAEDGVLVEEVGGRLVGEAVLVSGEDLDD